MKDRPHETPEQRARRLSHLKMFKPGQSGNPKGRPKKPFDPKDFAKAHGKEAFERVIELIKSRDPKIALAAAKEVLDRAYGKVSYADDSSDARGVTINIMKLNDQAEQPETIEAEAVEIRRLSS